MFGSWRVYALRAKLETDPRTMEIIRTEKHRAVLRGGSVLELLPAGSLDQSHPTTEIGVALLDQEILAGLGNYLKSEILYLTKTNPRALIRDLADKQVRAIIQSSRTVTRFSFENGSFTIPDEIRARLSETGMSPFTVGRKHYVFRRTNKPCWVCGTTIRQYRQGAGKGRITYYCPHCQQA